MILPAIFLVLATACTPNGHDKEQPESTSCESGFILDGSVCVPESCGTGRWGSLPVDDDTVYVDVVAEEGGDGTEEAPYSMIQRGLNRAGALGGGLVAVAAGTYPETLAFTTEHVDVHLGGRCREMVILDASVGDEETPGIGIDAGYAAVEVSGLTVRDASYVGMLVATGKVMVRNTAILGSISWGVGAYSSGFGEMTDLAMELCLIEGNMELGLVAINHGTKVTLMDTTVKDTQPNEAGEFGFGIEVIEGASLLSERCLIDGNTCEGLAASDPGTKVTLIDTTVMDTQQNANGEFGQGIEVVDGATVLAEGCLIDGNTATGLFASNPGTQVTLRDTTVKDTKPNPNGEFGWGITVEEGAVLSLESCLILGNTDVGLSARNPGTEVTLLDTTVRDTQLTGNGEYGWGITVEEGAVLSLDGCLIEHNTGVGLNAVHPGTQVTLADTVIWDTQVTRWGESIGINVAHGATLSAVGCLIDVNKGWGLFADDSGTNVTIVETTVKDTQPNGESGLGVEVQDGASLTAVGCLIDGNTTVGLIVFSPGTLVALQDTIVRNTLPRTDGKFGQGVQVSDGAILSADDCLIEGNTGAGLLTEGDSTKVTLRDTTVKDTQPGANGEFGRGIGVQDGATLSAEGCLILGNTDMGLSASNPATEVTLLDTTVAGTKLGADLSASCATGVNVEDGASLAASRLAVLSNQGPGLLVNIDGALECVGCTIEGNQFAGAAAVQGGTLTITNSIIEGTTPGVNLLGGVGVYAWPWVGDPPTVTVTNTIIQDNPIAGVWLIGNGTYVLAGNTISGGTGESFGSGSRCGDAILARDGVTAWDGTSGLLLQDNVFQDASGSGVFLDGSSALMSGNAYSGNAMDLVLQNQSCDSLPAWYSEALRRDLCPLYSYPTCYAEFFFVAMPSDPVDWDEGKDAHRPQFLPLNLVASPARSTYPLMPANRVDPPRQPLVLPR